MASVKYRTASSYRPHTAQRHPVPEAGRSRCPSKAPHPLFWRLEQEGSTLVYQRVPCFCPRAPRLLLVGGPSVGRRDAPGGKGEGYRESAGIEAFRDTFGLFHEKFGFLCLAEHAPISKTRVLKPIRSPQTFISASSSPAVLAEFSPSPLASLLSSPSALSVGFGVSADSAGVFLPPPPPPPPDSFKSSSLGFSEVSSSSSRDEMTGESGLHRRGSRKPTLTGEGAFAAFCFSNFFSFLRCNTEDCHKPPKDARQLLNTPLLTSFLRLFFSVLSLSLFSSSVSSCACLSAS